ncbi:MAG: pyridoxamine 5'-phosphate oxidase [Rhodobiaceae bacterium]|nr:pyridoxamine 5'-phosphate oxidase [Rhodobiaceae bacterium]|tara:strand:- start:591 stop:1223 length:633 start_codon:yes stop_codon:yes gene_type:complete
MISFKEKINMSLIKNNIKIEQNPFDLLEKWYKKAKKNEISNPNAMALSTVGSFNKPRTRMVLMKEIRENGIIFYTNSNSRKGNHINDNKNVSINFYWKSIKRQVLISGKIKKISSQESDKYFLSRSRKSQIGAWASKQSQTLKSKSDLKTKFDEIDKKYKGKEIPRPKHWNGYCIYPDSFEFWLQGEGRLHDRVEYKIKSGQWVTKLLHP